MNGCIVEFGKFNGCFSIHERLTIEMKLSFLKSKGENEPKFDIVTILHTATFAETETFGIV